jgi:hypothetical protein
MSERLEFDQASTRIERGLEALFSARDPEATFVAELEQQLLARVQTTPERGRELRFRRLWRQWIRPFSQHRWATAVAGLLLVVAVIVTTIGPQQVLASIQQLLGYVPGIGFADLEATRLLAAPTEATRDGVTLRVEQVIARSDRTEVVIRSDGLPPEDQLWPGGARGEDHYEPVLRLPDGRTLTTGTWTLRLGGGTLEFPPLPEGVYRVTLELARLPLVPAGAAPENWSIPLDLRPATGELVAELFPEPYLAGAQDTQQGITLRVLEVAHTPEETAVRLEVQWTEHDWQFPSVGHFRLPELRDDLGHVYHEATASSSGSSVQTEVIRISEGQDSTPAPAPEAPTQERTLAFAPVSPSAGQLTLWVDAVDFEVPAAAGFTVDLSDDPQVGDRWPLNVHLTVAGFPVHLSGAQLVQEELALRDGPVQRTLLQFDVDPVPDQNGRTLYGIGLVGDMDRFEGGSGGYDPQTGTIRTGLQLRDGAKMSNGPIEVRVEYASIAFHGPWTLTWTVPGAGEAGQALAVPITRHPANASQTRGDLTLGVSQAVQTDRLAAVTVTLEDPPPGVVLNRVMVWNPTTETDDLYLEDDRGNRYSLSYGAAWRPRREEVPEASWFPPISQTLSFEPLQPLAWRVTLHVPAVELLLEGSINFDVWVPEGVEMQPRSEPPWPASEPWAVDVPLDLAGYRLHLASARLEGINSTTSLALIPADTADATTGPWLTGLHPASIVAPNGLPLDLTYATRFGHTGTLFDLADPDTGAVLPGRYHFELEGITVAVPGPWELRWNLVEP